MRERHGLSKTPEYQVWLNMKARCTRPGYPFFQNYGGRGVLVCAEWLHSFQAFLKDMGPQPDPSYQIDRIDNGGPYSPQNCHWVTRSQNNRNKRTNHRVCFQGENLTLVEWAERTGVDARTLLRRIRAGWPIATALTAPTGWARCRTKKEKITRCRGCQTQFTQPKWNNRIFCSGTCRKQATRAWWPNIVCLICHRSFSRPPRGARPSPIVCGSACYGQYRSRMYRGKHHPRYKHGRRVR